MKRSPSGALREVRRESKGAIKIRTGVDLLEKEGHRDRSEISDREGVLDDFMGGFEMRARLALGLPLRRRGGRLLPASAGGSRRALRRRPVWSQPVGLMGAVGADFASVLAERATAAVVKAE
jgi:hypothetical protein